MLCFNFSSSFSGVDEDSHACPHDIPYTVPDLGHTSEEVGGEIVEEVVETNQHVLFEMDLDIFHYKHILYRNYFVLNLLGNAK